VVVQAGQGSLLAVHPHEIMQSSTCGGLIRVSSYGNLKNCRANPFLPHLQLRFVLRQRLR
jgi:hypothetical protein